jgi:hypothetical protein
MTYKDFTLESAEALLGLAAEPGDLFPELTPAPVPTWLVDHLARGYRVAALVSEKARSEFLVTPVLLAIQEFAPGNLTIYSGQRLDVDPERGLTGECDYILALTPPLPRLRAPFAVILEAKKGDVEAGLGQCLAQMEAARLFNERAGVPPKPIFGCVTSGENWQFMCLEGESAIVDRERFYLDNVGGILGAFRSIISQTSGTAALARVS